MRLEHKINKILKDILNIDVDNFYVATEIEGIDIEKQRNADYSIITNADNQYRNLNNTAFKKRSNQNEEPRIENNNAFVMNKYYFVYSKIVVVSILTYKNKQKVIDVSNDIILLLKSQKGISSHTQQKINLNIQERRNVSFVENQNKNVYREDLYFNVCYHIEKEIEEEVVTSVVIESEAIN